MKIRNGFVSNSSSSSFLIYGVRDEAIYNKVENGEITFKDKRIRTHCYSDGCAYYVGVSWDEIMDDETGKQFKETIKKEISDAWGHEVKCGTFSESWYDG